MCYMMKEFHSIEMKQNVIGNISAPMQCYIPLISNVHILLNAKMFQNKASDVI
jgi:hypothetical protein